MLHSVKGKKRVTITPLSTGVTLQVIPKAAVDKIPVFSMAYGLSASADGNLFPSISMRRQLWDGASAFIRHAADVEGGFDKLKGKKIRPRPSRRALWEGADPAPAGARSRLWLRA